MQMVRIAAITFLVAPFAPQLGSFDTPAALAQSRFAQPRVQQADGIRFREMDRNNDAVITRDEWRGSDRSFRVHDWNGDGILSGDEVQPGARRSAKSGDFRAWDDNEFTNLDHNRDGVISSTEWHGDSEIFLRVDRNRDNVLTRVEYRGGDMDDDRDDRFRDLDVNNNGRVEHHEWHASHNAFVWLDRDNDGVLSRAELVGDDRGSSTPGTTGAVGTSGRQADCLYNAPRAVDDVYQQVLGRSADPGSAELAQALGSGRMTVRDVVAQVAKSPESVERFWRPVVTELYRQVLQRDPTQNELSEAAANLASGRHELTDFIASTAARAANGEEGAIQVLYRRLLGREPDPQGLRNAADLARREGVEAVARRIVRSDEYRRRAGADGLLNDDAAAYQAGVQALYRQVLGREPDAQGLQQLTTVAASRGFDAVVDVMVASPEYERIVGAQGIPGRNLRYCGQAR